MDILNVLGIMLVVCGGSLFIGSGIGFYAGNREAENNE